MAEGLSYESFAGIESVKVNRDTLYEWEKNHKDFSDAKKRGESASLLFWEQLGIDLCKGILESKSAAIYCFTMKNRFKWKDSGNDESSGRSIKIIIDGDDEQL